MGSRRALLVLLVFVMMLASIPLPLAAEGDGAAPGARGGSRATLGPDDAMVQYAILTLLLNGGLKIGHVLWDIASKYFAFIPVRRRAPGAVPAAPKGGGE